MSPKKSREGGDIRQPEPKILLTDLRQLIVEARQDVARQVNSALVMLYWRIGQRIRQDILKEKRAEYGEQIVVTLSRQLTNEFGPGFTARNLANMVRFAEVFREEKIVHTLCAKLSWSHFCWNKESRWRYPTKRVKGATGLARRNDVEGFPIRVESTASALH
jgi:hypothetical protein